MQDVEPLFITKNGYGDLVVMSIEAYEEMIETARTDASISEAETEYAADGFSARRKGSPFLFTEETLWINML